MNVFISFFYYLFYSYSEVCLKWKQYINAAINVWFIGMMIAVGVCGWVFLTHRMYSHCSGELEEPPSIYRGTQQGSLPGLLFCGTAVPWGPVRWAHTATEADCPLSVPSMDETLNSWGASKAPQLAVATFPACLQLSKASSYFPALASSPTSVPLSLWKAYGMPVGESHHITGITLICSKLGLFLFFCKE